MGRITDAIAWNNASHMVKNMWTVKWEKNHFGPYVPLWHQTAWENKIIQKSCDFWSTAIQLRSAAAFVRYAELDPDVLCKKLHNTLNSAKGRGARLHSSASSNLPHAGTGKETWEQGWGGQGPDTQLSFGRTRVRHTGCRLSLNKVSGKTAIGLAGPEFLSHYISPTPPSSWSNRAAAAEASPSPQPRTAIGHHSPDSIRRRDRTSSGSWLERDCLEPAFHVCGF